METTAEPLSRTFKIEMRLANPAEKLKPGQIARVEVILRKKGLGIFIPLDSIIEFGSSPSVFVVKNLTAVGKAVKTGDIIGDEIEILEGLLPGEIVVISGQAYLKDGQRVVFDKEVNKG